MQQLDRFLRQAEGFDGQRTQGVDVPVRRNDSRLRIADCGLRICGNRLSNPQSKVCYRPGGANRVGKGDLNEVAEPLEFGDHGFGQTAFVAKPGSQSGDVQQEAFGLVGGGARVPGGWRITGLFQADEGAELLAPFGQSHKLSVIRRRLMGFQMQRGDVRWGNRSGRGIPPPGLALRLHGLSP